MNELPKQSRWIAIGIAAAVLVGVAAVVLAVPSLRETVTGWIGGKAEAREPGDAEEGGVEFFRAKNGNPGLRLSDESVAGLQIRPEPVVFAGRPQALPPQTGQINYDNDRLWTIRARFPGELAEVAPRPDTDGPSSEKKLPRPLRAFDKVEPNELIAVVWSQALGTAKALLVDAIGNLHISARDLARKEEGYTMGVVSQVQLDQSQRQVQLDKNALLTAERSLRFWKLTDKEIADIKAEAQDLIDRKTPRTIESEMKWARVEIRAPKFRTEAGANTLLTVVEKNTGLNDMVDPINSPPLFKLADLSRLQIWVHPPEDIARFIQDKLRNRKPGDAPLQWHIRFPSDSAETAPQVLDIVQVAPSLDPNQRTPMVIGYLSNPDGKRLVGQFVTATIFAPPDDDTIEVRTDAILDVRGQSFVFVETGKNEFTQRRVSVVRRFKDVSFVRGKLTKEEEELNTAEEKLGRQKIEPMRAGERVVTRGVVELMACLEEQLTKERVAPAAKGK
jgi:multidrug efflux pump subunit AcrA (membrane-fusion protein)